MFVVAFCKILHCAHFFPLKQFINKSAVGSLRNDFKFGNVCCTAILKLDCLSKQKMYYKLGFKKNSVCLCSMLVNENARANKKILFYKYVIMSIV